MSTNLSVYFYITTFSGCKSCPFVSDVVSSAQPQNLSAYHSGHFVHISKLKPALIQEENTLEEIPMQDLPAYHIAG